VEINTVILHAASSNSSGVCHQAQIFAPGFKNQINNSYADDNNANWSEQWTPGQERDNRETMNAKAAITPPKVGQGYHPKSAGF
jgi:hypothetical protein